MARYKSQDGNSLLLPVVLSEQIIPGSFAFAVNYLVDHELDLSALDAKFKNDEVGASAYDPRVMLKIVLLAYSQGLISSRVIEQACRRNVQFIAISGDSQPSHTHIAKFFANLSTQIKPLFRQVLLTSMHKASLAETCLPSTASSSPQTPAKNAVAPMENCATALNG
jgi:transposase